MAKKRAAKIRRNADLSPELAKEANAILELLENEEDEHWLIGTHFNRIVDGKLYKADGFNTAAEFASKILGQISESTLFRYGAIAKAFSEDWAKTYGSSRLELLLAYERQSDEKLPSGDPGQVTIKVPSADGSTSSKHFADCTVDELRAAVHKHHPSHPRPIPADYRPTIKALEDALEEAGDSTIIVMHVKPIPDDAIINFNLPFNYLEPLRDILVSVLGKPETAWRKGVSAPKRHGKPATVKQIHRRNGRPTARA